VPGLEVEEKEVGCVPDPLTVQEPVLCTDPRLPDYPVPAYAPTILVDYGPSTPLLTHFPSPAQSINIAFHYVWLWKVNLLFSVLCTLGTPAECVTLDGRCYKPMFTYTAP